MQQIIKMFINCILKIIYYFSETLNRLGGNSLEMADLRPTPEELEAIRNTRIAVAAAAAAAVVASSSSTPAPPPLPAATATTTTTTTKKQKQSPKKSEKKKKA